MADSQAVASETDLDGLTGKRLGPYLSYNAVSRVQIWQWCSAMGDRNPLYLDDNYRRSQGLGSVLAPPAMMQMWTMRDVNMAYAPGSTSEPPYQVLDSLAEMGFPGNVAVSYNISFHRYLREGDRPRHYTTVTSISDLKSTALGVGHFVTERVEYLDQEDALFAEALITYFQYRPVGGGRADMQAPADPAITAPVDQWESDFQDLHSATLKAGDTLPELAIPVTHKLIVAGAMATQDFIDGHHNKQAAQAAAMPDIFMNILTTSGLCARYLSDWAGPASRLLTLSFKLMTPNTPGDCMIMQGQVDSLGEREGEPCVAVSFGGRNRLGFHVTGKAELALVE